METSYTILDPDAASFLQLHHFLEDYDGLRHLGTDCDPDAALNSILKLKPQVVFVNLCERPAESFGMVRELYQYTSQLPYFIGMSKTRDHAYDAIKLQFFDYWILPYNELEIRKTLNKLNRYLPAEPAAPVICLQSYKDFQYLGADEILYLQADNNTTDFILRDGSRVSAFKTLKTFEEQLPENFIRIHQSYILNRNYVSRINFGKNRCSLRHAQVEIPFSRGYRQNVDALRAELAGRSISG